MNLTVINKGSNKQMRPNFKESEFFSKSLDAPKSHFLSTNLIDAIQHIRELFAPSGIVITSTYRTKAGNTLAGSGEYSNHRKDWGAIDFKFINKSELNDFKEAVRTKSSYFHDLRLKFGLTIGIYDSFIHIDDAKGQGVKTANQWYDNYGKFGYWDHEHKTNDSIAENWIETDFDWKKLQNNEDSLKGKKKIYLIALAAVLCLLCLKKMK